MKNSVLFLVLLFFFSFFEINSQWQSSSAGMFTETISSLAVSGSDVFAGTSGKGIYISNNNGADWYQSSLTTGNIRSIFIHNSKVFAGATSGIFTSIDNGQSWNFVSVPGEYFSSFAVKGNKLFAGGQKNALNGNLYFSTDSGDTWVLSSLTGKNIYSLSVTSSRIYASTYGGLFYSENDGLTWNELIFNHGAARVVAADNSGVIILTTGIGVTRSTDHGVTWVPLTFQSGNDYNCIIFSGNNVYIGSNNNLGVYVSVNKGASWVRTTLNKFVSAIALSGSTLYAGGDITGLYKTTNDGQTWSQPELFIQDIHALVSSGNTLVAGINTAISYSTNGGTSWNYTTFNAQTPPVYSLGANGLGNVYAGTVGYGIVTSQSNGTSFQYNHPFVGGSVYALCAFDNFVFSGSPTGVYRSINSGESFTQTSLNNRVVRALIRKDNIILAGTERNGVYFSTNNGDTWNQSSLNNVTVRAFTHNGSSVFAGVLGEGVFVTVDNGASWSQTSLDDKDIFALTSSWQNIYAGSNREANFFISTNNGLTWIQRSEGIVNAEIASLCIFNEHIFAGTKSSGIFKRPISELTGIEPISTEIPSQFSLSQNYPNPFNPSTTINFSIPLLRGVTGEAGQLVTPGREGVFTSIKIYDIIGNEITTLVNEQITPGAYSVEWDAANYPSGVYFYRLTAGEFIQTNKMILLK